MNIMRKFLGGSQDSGRPPGARGQEYHPEQVEYSFSSPRGAYFSAIDIFCPNSPNGSALKFQDLIARHLFHRFVAQPLHYLIPGGYY